MKFIGMKLEKHIGFGKNFKKRFLINKIAILKTY
jgi:hypothetical protein